MVNLISILAAVASITACAYGKEDRIVGGQFVDISEFPYQVSLTVSLASGSSLCGGSIIGKNWIVTAAHCLVNADSVVVRAGSNYADKKGQVITSKQYIIHPNYFQTDNDIALIYLPEELNFSDSKIKPIALASAGSKLTPLTTVTTSGWGTTSEGGNISPALQAVDLYYIDHSKCKKMMNGLPITKNMICAGLKSGKDTCQGDSGGPLVANHGSVLVGVISWGTGCARPGSAGVYTNIASEVGWIKSITGI